MIHSQSQFTDESFKPDLTPMLDIIFIVMVFLLLTANVSVHTLDVEIPKAEQETQLSQPTENVISIGILNNESQPWAIDGTQYDNWEEFASTLASTHKENSERPVVIVADKDSRVELMLKLIGFLQQHNIPATNIVMERPQ
ncbi:ExbD/TolR family protein [Vibrio mexicanus]|uniref:ExbD/TolR family protein n=1 Tax=Vibrio mexicanus TaxID=1004326 RepID=UPI00063C858F|nr:biopolymer transporter ExbD [Vibrio mexicanus]